MRLKPAIRALLVSAVTGLTGFGLRADDHVVVSSRADDSYTHRKFDGAQVRPESYVFGEGSFFGGITADGSLDRMKFRQIAESLAPELARQQFWPARDYASADLLLVVHWGVTTPHQSMRDAQNITTLSFDPRDTPHIDSTASDQLFKDPTPANDTAGAGDGSPNDIATSLRETEISPSFETIKGFNDEAARSFSEASNAQLLGYTKTLRQLGDKVFGSAEEATLRGDLTSERYLVIVCAYDLKTPKPPGQKRRPVWVAHLNIRAAGTNFGIALNRMAQVGANFFGRTTDAPTTLQAKVRQGHATPGELIILGVEEPTTKPAKK